MRITLLSLRNFKAIGPNEQRVEFKPITLLYGPNSAGKSTIVQGLHYFSEILSRNNCNPGTTQIGGKLNLGGFRNLVHLHEADQTIELAVNLSLDDTLLPSYGGEEEQEHMVLGEVLDSESVFDLSTAQSVEVRLGVRWSQQFAQAYVATYTVSLDGKHFATIVSSADHKTIELETLNCSHRMFATALNDEPDSISVGEAMQNLLDEFTTMAAIDDTTSATNIPLQLRTGRGAMPEFGRVLPLEPLFDDIDPDAYKAGSAVPRLSKKDLERFEQAQQELAQAKLTFQALNNYISRVIVGAGELACDCLQQFLYLGPLREIPGRHYSPELSPGLARWSSGLGAWDQLYNEGEKLTDKVNDWLADDQRLDAGYEVHFNEYKALSINSPLMIALKSGDELLEDSDWIQSHLDNAPTQRQVNLRDLRTNIALHAEDLGTGISQVLPVLVAALGHNKNIVAIEQPELHVHPKFQVALGELFIHAIKHEHIARDTVFILETHSEYMMLRFLRRLYETANDELPPDAESLNPDDIGVYYVNPTGDSVEISHLRLTEEGEFLDRWPNGFFPERKKELF